MARHKYWRVDTTEVNSRLKEIRAKIYAAKNPDKILGKLDNEKPNLFSHLDLIYLLINDDSEITNVFWDAFVKAQSHFLQINPVLDVKQLADLLDLAEKNHTEINNDNSQKLLDDLKHFISINGLIQKSSNDHIKNIESLNKSNFGIAITEIDSEYKKALVDRYKQILLDGISLLHGISPSWYPRHNFFNSLSPDITIREKLAKHGVIKNLDFMNNEENGLINNYTRIHQKQRSYDEHIAYFLILSEEEAEDLLGEPKDDFEIQHYKHNKDELMGKHFEQHYDLKVDTINNFTYQTWYCINEINFLIKLLHNFDYRSSELTSGIEFGDFLETSAKEFDIEIPEKFDKKLALSLEMFSKILNARYTLEEKSHEYEWRTGPYSGQYDWAWKDRIISESQFDFIQISIEELGFIAMSKEVKSIRNEMLKEDTFLRPGSEDNSVTMLSAKKWLKDSKRKYRFYELININELNEERVTLESLKNTE